MRGGHRMSRPVILDAFCKAGGSTRGLQMAGWKVVGCDIEEQPRYCGDDFILGDALEVIPKMGHCFDAIAASPPCQAYSTAINWNRRFRLQDAKLRHPDLIEPVRDALIATGKPYVIENVLGARKKLIHPILLCGTYFGLKVYRHRLFESNCFLMQPAHSPHRDRMPSMGKGLSPNGFVSITSGGMGLRKNNQRTPEGVVMVAGHFRDLDYARYAMGIDWMNKKELAQAIPPAYMQFVGEQLILYV